MTSVYGIAADLLNPPAGNWRPLPHQIPPPTWPDARSIWLLIGGRGIGKTDGGASVSNRYMLDHPGTRGRIIAPTLGDAREACVEGVSGLKAHNPAVRFNGQSGTVHWPNGSRMRIFGAHTPEDVERLRAGGNSGFDWYEELCAWRHLDDVWDQADFGLRLGSSPPRIITTTPKLRKRIAELLRSDEVAISRASTSENPHLSETVRANLERRYGGTRLGRQELEGELLEEVEGAIWRLIAIDEERRASDDDLPDMVRVVVAIDPAVTNTSDSDETGIIVAGKGVDGHAYILADRSCRLAPNAWAMRAVQAYREFDADRMVPEVNNGGDMVVAIIGTVDPRVHVKAVHATRGKLTRAEPVSALYEQGKVHHVGTFPELEDQLTTWTPESGSSPDRLDALVWSITDLMLGSVGERAFVIV